MSGTWLVGGRSRPEDHGHCAGLQIPPSLARREPSESGAAHDRSAPGAGGAIRRGFSGPIFTILHLFCKGVACFGAIFDCHGIATAGRGLHLGRRARHRAACEPSAAQALGRLKILGVALRGTLGLRSVPATQALADEALQRIWRFQAEDLIKALSVLSSLVKRSVDLWLRGCGPSVRGSEIEISCCAVRR